MIEFTASTEDPPVAGKLMYRDRDHAFDFEVASSARKDVARLAGGKGTTAIAIGTLQLEVGVETGNVLFVWGYHPRFGWRKKSLTPPVATPGILRAHPTGYALERGVGIKLATEAEWTTSVDVQTGWVRVAPSETDDSDAFVEFASGCVAGLRGRQLCSIWLSPG